MVLVISVSSVIMIFSEIFQQKPLSPSPSPSASDGGPWLASAIDLKPEKLEGPSSFRARSSAAATRARSVARSAVAKSYLCERAGRKR